MIPSGRVFCDEIRKARLFLGKKLMGRKWGLEMTFMLLKFRIIKTHQFLSEVL